MTNSINPYELTLAPCFPHQEFGENPKKVTHYLIYLNKGNALDQWLNPDPKQLKAGETIKAKVEERVNSLVTKMKLHPLHLCAMFNRPNMAEKLLETRVCQIDPQDHCDFTPLHHAAVNNFKPLISLLLKYGANANALNQRGGTYSNILELVHPQYEPSKQVCYFKDSTGEIVQGNGLDFQRITGAEVFLNQESTISKEEIVIDWAQNPPAEEVFPEAIAPYLTQAYEQFLKNPPQLYLEEQEGIGVNVRTNQDIEAGAVIAEYLGEFKPRTGTSNPYFFKPFDGKDQRGISAYINDSFPNCASFSLPNVNGLLERIVFCATRRIPKGSQILCNYGIGQENKFKRHQELNPQGLTHFFNPFTKQDYRSLSIAFQRAQEELLSDDPTIQTFDSFDKMLYLATTPHAMLKLVCDQTLPVEAIQLLCIKVSCCYKLYADQENEIKEFISDLVKFSSALKHMPSEQERKQCRNGILQSLPTMTVPQLRALMAVFQGRSLL